MHACTPAHICIHTYIHTYIYVYIHVCIHTHIHTYTRAFISTHIHMYTHSHIHTHTHHTYIHTYTTLYIHINIHTNIHTYKRTYIRAYTNIHVLTRVHTYKQSSTNLRSGQNSYIFIQDPLEMVCLCFEGTHKEKETEIQSLCMGWLRLACSLKLHVSLTEYCLFYKSLLQKRHMILRSLLIAATPYLSVPLSFCLSV